MTEPLRWGPLRVANHQRRQAVRAGELTGLDAIEVGSAGGNPVVRVSFLGRTPTGLTEANVRILPPPLAAPLRVDSVLRHGDDETTGAHLSVRLSGRIGSGVYWLRLVEAHQDGRPSERPLRGVDPRFAQLPFSFDPNRPVPTEPAAAASLRSPAAGLSSQVAAAPGSYLARDYAALRQLLLDRLAVTLPADQERNPADFTVMLLELFAYLGDELAYYQDDAATEAYLPTARRRRSVRRHARLVGYRLHEGCQARCWVSVQVREPVVELELAPIGFVVGGTLLPGAAIVRDPSELPDPTTVFSPLLNSPDSPIEDPAATTATFYRAHNSIGLWHFGEHDSTLSRGATSASLIDRDSADPAADPAARALALRPGDVLIFEALTDPAGLGPPDLRSRHPVRLTEVHCEIDPLYQQNLLRVCWSAQDALPFDLPVSITAAGANQVSHACANVVLTGHGRPVSETVPLARPRLNVAGLSHAVPFPDPEQVAASQAHQLRTLYDRWHAELAGWQHLANHGYPLAGDQLRLLRRLYTHRFCDEIGLAGGDEVADAWQQAGALGYLIEHAPRLFRRRQRRAEALAGRCQAHGPLPAALLAELEADWGPVLIGQLRPESPACWGSAAQAITAEPRRALPVLAAELISAEADPDRRRWLPRPDLLDSAAGAPELTVESDDDRIGWLRFAAGPTLAAASAAAVRYWTGNGLAGNLAADSLNALVAGPEADQVALGAISAIRNPLPATGGTDPESLATARQAIPASFALHQPRALDAADYAGYARTLPGVGRAAAELRFDGSRPLVELCLTATGGGEPSPALLADSAARLRRVRRLGHQLRVRAPHYRSLLIELAVRPAAGADLPGLREQIMLLLSAGRLADGRPALFNPERLEFGQTFWASAVLAAVQELPQVVEVNLNRFGLLDRPVRPGGNPVSSALRLSALQLARLDNDPRRPDRGSALVSFTGPDGLR